MGKDFMGPLNDPADLFADDAHAEAHPEVYAPRERVVAPAAVATGERNAVVNTARKRAIQRSLFPRSKRTAKDSKQHAAEPPAIQRLTESSTAVHVALPRSAAR